MSQSQPATGDPKEPNFSLGHARLKVAWAEHTINQLNSLINQIADKHRKTATGQFDFKNGVLAIQNATVHPQVALMAEDAVFSLRSALDCCWMGLKRAVSANAHKATLPRKDTREEFIKALPNASMEKSFQGSDAFLINKLRPYRNGNEILWFVGQVDNWNKHNKLITTMRQTTVVSFSGTMAGGGTVSIKGVKVIGDAKLLGFSPTAGFQPDSNANLSFEVMLVSRKPIDERPLMPFLFAALKETSNAVEAFASQFGKA